MTFTGDCLIIFSLEKNSIKLTAQEAEVFERFQAPKPLMAGLSVVFGKVKGTRRWEVYAFLFDRTRFSTISQAQVFADKFLKAEIHTLIDYNSFTESRRRWLNAYLQISSVDAK